VRADCLLLIFEEVGAAANSIARSARMPADPTDCDLQLAGW
jgi:hypothetical protein